MKKATFFASALGMALVGAMLGRALGLPRLDWRDANLTPPPPKSALPIHSTPPNHIPSSWIDENGMRAAEKFAGLTPAQRYIALKVLNEKPCTCECKHGSLAKCRKEDPVCKMAEALVGAAIDAVKAGHTAEEIMPRLEIGQVQPVGPEEEIPPSPKSK